VPGKRAAGLGEKAVRLSTYAEGSREETPWPHVLAGLLESPKAGEVAALVVGQWWTGGEYTEASEVVEALVAARDRLPNLRAVFLGDITMEECEISWIRQTDVSPLLGAFPELEELTIRGGEGLSLGRPRHAKLKNLTIQSGGIPRSVVRELARADLPALQHLELWLGASGYGGDATIDDVEPLLSGKLFPKLRYLGLKNSELSDAIATLAAKSPLVKRVEVLDFSMGTLGDKGAAALMSGTALAGLKKLELRHHYCSEETVERLGAWAKKNGVKLDADRGDAEELDEDDDDFRYVEVGE
jgi:hypothetical protein